MTGTGKGILDTGAIVLLAMLMVTDMDVDIIIGREKETETEKETEAKAEVLEPLTAMSTITIDLLNHCMPPSMLSSSCAAQMVRLLASYLPGTRASAYLHMLRIYIDIPKQSRTVDIATKGLRRSTLMRCCKSGRMRRVLQMAVMGRKSP